MDAATMVHEPAAVRVPAGARSRAGRPSWAAVAAWGAGLLELALGAGLMTSPGGGAARGAGAALVILGAGGLGWGAATLARGRVISPRVGVFGALVGLIVPALALAADPAHVSVMAAGAASALAVVVALACGLELRADRRPAETPSPRLSVLLTAAVIVAAIVAPSLGATEAGRLAPDHGQHGLVDPGHH